jgi:hypothetical protein
MVKSSNPSLKRGRNYPLTPVIRQGCFQSVIKRIIKILWATIVIPRKGGLGEVLTAGERVERSPL